jgi:hypothetical protein
MSWLKKSTKVVEERNKRLAEEQRSQENEVEKRKQEIIAELEKFSTRAIQSLETWNRLECDRIIMDIQKNLLGGDLGRLLLTIRYAAYAFATEIAITKNRTGWLFSETAHLETVLTKAGFNPERYESFRIKRCITQKVSRWQQGGEVDYEWEEDSPIFTLEVDHPNIYCDGKLIGTLTEIGNSSNLEERLDEILASKLT